jgi:hypothetical protein
LKLVLRWTLAIPLLLTLLAAPAAAVVVSYAAQNLADEVGGEDLWAYQYRLDEFPFDAGYGFTVYFDPDLYADLETTPPSPGPDWDALGFEPDPNLGDPGFYDAEALADDPTTGVVFTIAFRWLGVGTPGPQPFEVREPAPSYAMVENGTTVLPEASRVVMGVSALAALATLRRVAA